LKAFKACKEKMNAFKRPLKRPEEAFERLKSLSKAFERPLRSL
jgi:hypothetical protein